MSYSDIMDDNQLLDHIRCNLIDVETEQQKTNDLLGQILVELKKISFRLGTTPPDQKMKKEDNFIWPQFETVECGFCGWQEPDIVRIQQHIRENH